MSEEAIKALQHRVAELTAQLQAFQEAAGERQTELTQRVRDANQQIWEINSLLASLRADLLNPIYAIIANSEVLHTTTSPQERIRLAKANDRAARLLEHTLLRLVDLARLATDDLTLAPETCSLHSLTRSALLLMRSSAPVRAGWSFVADLEDADVMVDVDESRVSHLITSAVLSVLERMEKGGIVRLGLQLTEEGGWVQATWIITIEAEGVAPDLRRALELPDSGQPMAGRAALGVRYTQALAAALDAEITVQDVPPRLVVKMRLPLCHRVPEFDMARLGHTWSDASVVVCEDPPVGFGSLGVQSLRLPAGEGLQGFIDRVGAKLLVLHHFAQDDDETLARNLQYGREADVPVLLRAVDLSYEEFSTYRANVDAVILEPATKETLARYVTGLVGPDRRSTRRPAELH